MVMIILLFLFCFLTSGIRAKWIAGSSGVSSTCVMFQCWIETHGFVYDMVKMQAVYLAHIHLDDTLEHFGGKNGADKPKDSSLNFTWISQNIFCR